MTSFKSPDSAKALISSNFWGALLDPAQARKSPLYVKPVNMVNTLAKVLAEEQVLRSRLTAGAEP